MVRGMRSLANLLEAALGRSATEVVLESGQPIVFTTARGPEVEQSVLPRTDLFDMIVAAVDDAQQIELAVGNPVRFTIEAGASWSVLAEPGIDGMIVRAQRPEPAPILEIDLEEEPGFALDDVSFSVREGAFTDDFDDDFGGEFAATPTVRSHSSSQPMALMLADDEDNEDDEAYDAPTLQGLESNVDRSRTSGQAPAAPFESGTWALADEDDFDVGLDEPDEGSLPSGFPEPPPSGYDPGHIGVPHDDDEASSFDPFAEPAPEPQRQPMLSPTLPAVGVVKAAPAVLESARSRPIVAETPTRRELSAAPRAQAATRRELPVRQTPEADTHRELPSVGRAPAGLAAGLAANLGGLAMSIGEGVLVYVREPGLADSLAQSFAAPSVIVDDQIDADEVWARVRGLPVGTIVIVRREDPSSMLDWILRRLEEGFRVFVETRARTVEGARRILLGVGASDRAERWLDSQVTLVVEPGESGPQLRQAS
jgi:hypothetical protein